MRIGLCWWGPEPEFIDTPSEFRQTHFLFEEYQFSIGKVFFPRSNDRGPIEAMSPKDRWALLGAFPRSNDRGPIEALRASRFTLQKKYLSAVE